ERGGDRHDRRPGSGLWHARASPAVPTATARFRAGGVLGLGPSRRAPGGSRRIRPVAAAGRGSGATGGQLVSRRARAPHPRRAAPLVQPLWRASSGRTAAAYEARATNSLRNGWMPMPAVQWSPQPGLELHSEAIAADQAAGPVTFVRHRLVNTGASRVEGQLAI